jgi:hypothetical protein
MLRRRRCEGDRIKQKVTFRKRCRTIFSISISCTGCKPDRARGASTLWAAAKNDEETEKRVASAILADRSLISIDNVNSELGGDLLCDSLSLLSRRCGSWGKQAGGCRMQLRRLRQRQHHYAAGRSRPARPAVPFGCQRRTPRKARVCDRSADELRFT